MQKKDRPNALTCDVSSKLKGRADMLDKQNPLKDEEARSKKVIKIALIALSIVEIAVMIVVFVRHRSG